MSRFSTWPAYLPSLGGVEVRIQGTPAPMAEDARQFEWSGTASADEPIVALGIVASDKGLSWFKSSSAIRTEIEIRFRLRPLRWEGPDVQVHWSLRNSSIPGAVSGHRESRGEELLPQPARLETGRLWPFSRIGRGKGVDCRLLILPRRHVRSMRTHIWGLRERLRSGIPDPLATILSRGRTGVVPGTPADRGYGA